MLWPLLTPLCLAGTELAAGWSAESGLHPGVGVSTARRAVVAERGAASLTVLAGHTTRLTHHRQRHTRLSASLDLGASVALGALALDLRAGAGAGRTFLAGQTYVATDSGLEPVPLAGQWGWMPWAAAGFSGPTRGGRVSWFAQAGLLAQLPLHDHWAPFLIADVGLRIPVGAR